MKVSKISTATDPSIIVIFGITGDLSKRYLLPALYHLMKDDLLHAETEIVGISRRELNIDQLFADVELCVNEVDKVCDPEVLGRLKQHSRMLKLDLDDEAGYRQLRLMLDGIESEKGVCLNRLYYLSIPPSVYGAVIPLMGQAKLEASCQHAKAKTALLIEKPFGYDYASAEALIANTSQVFQEEQLYRIDHYLAKETVQNILTFRFQNPIFDAVWNQEHIDRIDISASEKIGIEGRATFYETLGALRDFIQSHLIQLMALVTMDKPAELSSELIHASKQAVLSQVLPVARDQLSERVRRGQYEGYRAEVGNSDSTTETFAGITVYIDSERWRDVPITLWTGKALDDKKTEISLSFRNNDGGSANRLRFRIQPNEGIELELLTKTPGFDNALQTAVMDFSYRQRYGNSDHPNAYERVLADAIRGDHTLFATSNEVLEAWRIVQPVFDAWAADTDDLVVYKKGVAGSELTAPIAQ